MSATVMDAIMLFGDSLTQNSWLPYGFGERLSNAYVRKLDVINRGFSGYNTEWGIKVLKQCLATQHEQNHVPKIRMLVIWFGANDACIKPSPQHVPLEKFAENLRYAVHMITSPTSPYFSEDTKVVLITPPPVNTHQRGADLALRDPPRQLDREFNVTKAYADAVIAIGGQEGIPVVDLWSAIWVASGCDERAMDKYLWDGLHLNGDGYGILYEAFVRTIGEQLPELNHDRLQYVFAPWQEIVDSY